MGTRQEQHKETARQAEADLKRLGEQSEKLLGARTTQDTEPEDQIEVWGKRLGRGVGYALGLYLLYWFASRYGLI